MRFSPATGVRLLASYAQARLLKQGYGPHAFFVFSKDRPVQLDALLRSMRSRITGEYYLALQWCASGAGMEAAYIEVLGRHSSLVTHPIREQGFRDTFVDLLSSLDAKTVTFLVDDMLFVAPFDMSLLRGINPAVAVPTLRLGPHMNYFQTTGRTVAVPRLRPARQRSWLAFSWTESQDGWAMPVALDGHVFATAEMTVLARALDYRAPNSLEGALNAYRFWFRYRKGLCLQKPVIVNFAFNRVNSENDKFPCGDYSADFFLDRWRAGLQLDVKALTETDYSSCHVVAEPIFEVRSW